MKIFIALIFVIAIIPQYAKASDDHHKTMVINNHNTYVTHKNGDPMSFAASQHHFDWATERLQWSIGAAYMNEGAISFSLGQKFRQDGELYNFTLSTDGEETAASLGINGRF